MANEKAMRVLTKALKKKVSDEFEVGDVIRFISVAEAGVKEYDYACIKAGDGKWYFTGGAGWYGQGLSFANLVDKVLNNNDVKDIKVSSGWVDVK